MTEEIFDSAVRSSGDLAGVFEFDGATSYFYLVKIDESGAQEILGAIHVYSGKPDLSERNIAIMWDSREERVGLFIKGDLWAVFDGASRIGQGGNYRGSGPSSLSAEAMRGFERPC